MTVWAAFSVGICCIFRVRDWEDDDSHLGGIRKASDDAIWMLLSGCCSSFFSTLSIPCSADIVSHYVEGDSNKDSSCDCLHCVLGVDNFCRPLSSAGVTRDTRLTPIVVSH